MCHITLGDDVACIGRPFGSAPDEANITACGQRLDLLQWQRRPNLMKPGRAGHHRAAQTGDLREQRRSYSGIHVDENPSIRTTLQIDFHLRGLA